MKEMYAYQEVRDDITQGEKVTFTMHPHLHLTAGRKSLDEQTIITTLTVCVGEDAIGAFTLEFSSMEMLLAAFDKEAVDVVLIAYPDRLLRFGFPSLLQAFAWRGVGLEVLEEPEKQEPLAEMTADLLTVVTVFSGRMYGHRAKRVHERMTSRTTACLQEAEQTHGAS